MISISEGCDERLFGAHDSEIHTSWLFFFMSEILVLPLPWCSLRGGLDFFDGVSLGGASLFLFCVRHIAARSRGFVGRGGERGRPFDSRGGADNEGRCSEGGGGMRRGGGRRERGRPEQPGRNPQRFLFVRVLDGSDEGDQTETNREPRSGSSSSRGCGISDCRF